MMPFLRVPTEGIPGECIRIQPSEIETFGEQDGNCFICMKSGLVHKTTLSADQLEEVIAKYFKALTDQMKQAQTAQKLLLQ